MRCLCVAILSSCLAAISLAMQDGLFPHHPNPSNCKNGCALWSDLAKDGNTRNQADVDAKWTDKNLIDAADRNCAMPANDPGAGDAWCYCKDSGDASWGNCTPPSSFPSELAVYAVSKTEVVVVFVTAISTSRHHQRQMAMSKAEALRPDLEVDPSPTPVIDIQPVPEGKSEAWVAIPPGGTATNRLFHFVYLSGLQPRTNYTYRVRCGDSGCEWSDQASFVSLPALGQPIRFAIWGDMGVYSYNNMDSVVKYFQEGSIDFAGHIGDHGYNIGVEDRGDGYFDGNSLMYTHGIWVPGIGNHEFYDQDQFNRFDTYTSGIRKYHKTSNSSTYYSLDIGLLHLVVLDSTTYFGQPGANNTLQIQWLEKDLASVDRTVTPWLMVTAHHPLYCSSITYYDDSAEKQVFGDGYDPHKGDIFQNCAGSGTRSVEAMRADWEPIFLKYGVDLYMCGHEHNYESIYPVKNNQQVQDNFMNPKAPVHVVSGAGGGPALDQFGTSGPWTRFRTNEAWSHSVVEVVNATTLIWKQYFNSYYKNGALADEFTIVQENHGPFV